MPVNAHPFVLLSYQGREIEIDVEMVILIKKMWASGIETFFCCQGDPFMPAPRYEDDDGEETESYSDGYISLSRKGFIKFLDILGLEFILDKFISIEPKSPSNDPEKVIVRFENKDLEEITRIFEINSRQDDIQGRDSSNQVMGSLNAKDS